MLIKYEFLHCLFYALDVNTNKCCGIDTIPHSGQYKISLSGTWLRTGDLQEHIM